jgi:rhamnogalacturonyl hydrolase YesR
MKLTIKTLTSFFLFTLLFGCNHPKEFNTDFLIQHSESQLEYAVKEIKAAGNENTLSPRTIENGALKLVPTQDWTSGFFPGNLWMMYELTGDNKWSKLAMKYTLALDAEKWNGTNHDTGFKMYCSFGNAVKYSDNPELKEVLIQSAKTLSTRFSPVVGCIRSWDDLTEHWNYPVIIDNMMNLELLMWAAKETGNESFREIAVKHAQTTMKNHFRNDYSSYHVVDYNPETGEVVNKNTHQGFADESSWARGQAWGLYGFTMMYRETGMVEFLDQAKYIADYIIGMDSIKEGKIPYWDFNAPNIPNEPYDASAAAVISSALFELYGYTNNETYSQVAKNLLVSLSSPEFLAPVGENEGFLLKHSTGSKPFNSEIDVPLVYADYYYLESLIKYKNYEENVKLAQNSSDVNQ